MEKIKIKKSPTADTRSCDWTKISKDELAKSTRLHIKDVQAGLFFLAALLEEIAKNHDHTKLDYLDDFYEDFKTGFKRQKWYKRHQDEERHHLKKEEFVQEDVNLLDILESIVDGVMAGRSRSGEYTPEIPNPELLRKAYLNTAKLFLNIVEIDEGDIKDA